MSKVLEAWDAADFETVAENKLVKFKRKDIRRAIRESRYALRMFDLLSETVDPKVQFEPQSRPIRVVTILHASLPHHTGGYTGRAQGLLNGLLDLGAQVRPYTRPGFYVERVDRKASFPYPISQVGQVQYRHLPAEFARKNGELEYMYHSIEWYREVFLFERPNVVHVRSTYLIALPAMIAARQLGIPVLYEVSGLWELVYEGRGEVGRAQRTERLENIVATNATRVVSMNNSMAQLITNRSGGTVSVGLVPNAVDTQKFEQVTPLAAKQNFEFDLGYVGSLVDYEGLDLLVRAIALLKSRGRTVTAKIVGKGNQYSHIEKLVEKEGVEKQVVLTGPVGADEAVQQFEDINIIVLPRRSTPATEIVTPLKPFESMAAQRPLLVSDVSALEEVSREETCALVFSEGNIEELALKIIALLDDRELQLSLVKTAGKLVAEEHNWKNVSARMLDELTGIARNVSSAPFVTASPGINRIGNFVLPGKD